MEVPYRRLSEKNAAHGKACLKLTVYPPALSRPVFIIVKTGGDIKNHALKVF